MEDTTQALTHSGDGHAKNLAAPEPNAPARFDAYAIGEVKRQVGLVQEVLEDVMQKGTHYGTIPGTGKPTLYKAGAEKLNLTFRLSPRYEVKREDFPATEERPEGHREYTVHCQLYHITSGDLWGEGVGSCSTLESKYRYRRTDEATDVSVPKAFWDSGDDMRSRDDAILKNALESASVDVPAGAYIGATKEKGDWLISVKAKGEHPDIADVYNTCLKMAKKRAHVDAVLTCTAASDIFTQDVEDFAAPSQVSRSTRPQKQSAPVQGQPRRQGPPPRRRRRESPGRGASGEAQSKAEEHLKTIEERLQNVGDDASFEEAASRYEEWAREEQSWPEAQQRRLAQIIKKERARRGGEARAKDTADDIMSGETAL